MIFKTKDFQAVAKTLLLAVDNNTTNLELYTEQDSKVVLAVTNGEYYVKVNLPITNYEGEDFHATVDAILFLNLISGLTTEEFTLTVQEQVVKITAGRSSYKLAISFDNDAILRLPEINLLNKTVNMKISKDILNSILFVNSKELEKEKAKSGITESPYSKLYYITDEGCFTFTTGACINAFKLEKPIQMLLSDRIVKLFKLFKEDVDFKFGHDELSDGTLQTKVIFTTPEVSLSAIILNDEKLLQNVQRPYNATKGFIEEAYPQKVVLSVEALKAAIARIMLFTKNSVNKANLNMIPVEVIINNEFTLKDQQENTEVIPIENGSFTTDAYKLTINIVDLKLILDSCTNSTVTLNCGNHRSVVVNRVNIYNVFPEQVALND
jgi:hypothetical protein